MFFTPIIIKKSYFKLFGEPKMVHVCQRCKSLPFWPLFLRVYECNSKLFDNLFPLKCIGLYALAGQSLQMTASDMSIRKVWYLILLKWNTLKKQSWKARFGHFLVFTCFIKQKFSLRIKVNWLGGGYRSSVIEGCNEVQDTLRCCYSLLHCLYSKIDIVKMKVKFADHVMKLAWHPFITPITRVLIMV